MKQLPLSGRTHDSAQPRLSAFLNANVEGIPAVNLGPRPVIGVVEGCGIGPRIIGGALQVLHAVEEVLGLGFEIRHCGPVGEKAQEQCGTPFPETAASFFEQVFACGGAVLNGPAGGRFVYDLRKRFDLFCKFVPTRPWPQLARAALIRGPEHSEADILFVRDNSGGVYQGLWKTRTTNAGRIAKHCFSYSEAQVQRIAEVSARAAATRRGTLHIILKDGGVPAISNLWRDVTTATAAPFGVRVLFMNVDLAAYELVRNPGQFDVVLTPNLFGDILVDLAGALLGSRGLTFSGNFNSAGHGVFQTNHGCAHDLAGADVANPAGQILSLAMLLREAFGLEHAASLVERALAEAWRQGWRTADIAEPGCTLVGTDAMATQVARQIAALAESGTVA